MSSLPELPERTPRSMNVVRVGNREYPMQTVGTCAVCQSPYRFDIERLLVRGASYKSVQRQFEGQNPPGPSSDSIRIHVARGHLPLPHANTRAVIEQRAKDLGRDIEQETASLVDSGVVSQEIIRRGFEMIQDGDLQPSMGDLIKAMEFQAKLDASTSSGDLSAEAWQEALMEYFRLAQRVMEPDQWQSFTQEISNSPILKAISSRQDAIDGEVVEG